MANKYIQTEYNLTPGDIDASLTQIIGFLNDRKTEKKDILRVRLGMEESLLRYRDAFGEEKKFILKIADGLGRIRISVYVKGGMVDPFVKSDISEQDSSFMRAALANMGEMPVWKYSRGINTISYALPKKTLSSWERLATALVLAIVCGTVLKLMPQEALNTFREGILTPLLDTFMNLLSGVAVPMIFLSVVWGIYSVGDVSAFSVLGKALLLRLLIFTVILTLMTGLVMIPVFRLVPGDAEVGGFSQIFEMFLNIVPGNIIKPFAEGNTLQILFIGIVMGISMIIIGEKTQTVAVFAEQLNYIVQLIMEFISRLVPLFVFGSLLNVILNNHFSDVLVSTKLFGVNMIGCAAFLLIDNLIVGICMKMNPLVYLKKEIKVFLIGLTTASSAAAFSTNLETCKEKFGIEESFSNFGIPFLQVIYRPSVTMLYFSSVLFAAETYAVPVSVPWFAAAFFMSILLSFATPPVPGGTLASITVLFAQLGLPQSGIAVVLALSIILDFAETATNIVDSHTILILTAKKLNLIDEDVLRKEP